MRDTMPVRFWIPTLEVIEEECEIENIIFSGDLNEERNNRFEKEEDERNTEEDNNDTRVKTNQPTDRTKMDENKGDENNLGEGSHTTDSNYLITLFNWK